MAEDRVTWNFNQVSGSSSKSLEEKMQGKKKKTGKGQRKKEEGWSVKIVIFRVMT